MLTTERTTVVICILMQHGCKDLGKQGSAYLFEAPNGKFVVLPDEEELAAGVIRVAILRADLTVPQYQKYRPLCSQPAVIVVSVP